MLDGDDRTDAAADATWHSANDRLFNPPSFPTAERPLPTLSPTAVYNCTAQDALAGHTPYELVYESTQDPTPTVSPHASCWPVSPGPVTTAMLASLAHAAASVPYVPPDIAHVYLPAVPPPLVCPCIHCIVSLPPTPFPRPTLLHLNAKVMRRILAARESIFKYGVYLPRNDRDADASPESLRWNSGRQLEWLRLKKVGAFEYDWTRERLAREFPHYLPSDIGFLFFIYDYKFSGEHRVRMVFDGSRQGINTYDDTYSPTVRPESSRIFHVYAVEMGWDIRQYDVPQAFLQSSVDHDIFVHPPRTNVEFPGQLLKLRLALYGAKQSSALFFKLLNGFLLSLGFVASTMDACFYQRPDALLIVHVDDIRCAGTPDALLAIYEALFTRFKITTGEGNRFLGMDTHYTLRPDCWDPHDGNGYVYPVHHEAFCPLRSHFRHSLS
jgi:hypothetical protein